jgi:hypothetical protein
MAISFVSNGTYDASASAGVSVNPTYPAGIVAGQLLVVVLGQKGTATNNGSVTTPSGWTLVGSLANGGGYGAQGAGVGNTSIYFYTKVADGTETGTLAITLTNNQITLAQITNWNTSGNGGWLSSVVVTGQVASTPTSPMTMTASSAMALQASDMLIAGFATAESVGGRYSAHSFAVTGATVGPTTEIAEQFTTIGDDLGVVSAYGRITSGSVSVAPSWTTTVSSTLTNIRGSFGFLRLREAPGTGVTYVGTGTTTLGSPLVLPTHASTAVGNLMVMLIHQKPSVAPGGTVTVPYGWNLTAAVLDKGGYGTTVGVDQGNSNMYVYTKIANDTDAGRTYTITATQNSAISGSISTFASTINFASLAVGSAEQTTTPTSPLTITTGALAITAGDMLFWAFGSADDLVGNSYSVESITASGATLYPAVEIDEWNATAGNKVGGVYGVALVNTGSASAVSLTTTIAGTLTNVRGPFVVLRIRGGSSATVAYVDAFESTVASSGEVTRILDAFEVVVASSTSLTTDLWVWDGTTAIPSDVTVWTGSAEIETTVTVT